MSTPSPEKGFRLRPEAAKGASFARYARNAAGLGTLLGGTLAMAAYFVAGLLPLAPWGRGLVALVPFAWICGKEILKRRVQAGFRGIVPGPTPLERTIHKISTVVVTVSCLGVFVFAIERLWGRSAPWEVYASLAFTLAMPVVVGRFLHTVEELTLGIFLMFQAVLLLAGRPAQLGSLIHIPVVAAVAMLVGAWQHHEFVTLRRQGASGG